MMPGTRLMQFARRWFPPSTVSSVFEPLVADWQRQWRDATPAQRRWTNAKGGVAFATTAARLAPRVVLAASSLGARPLLLAGAFWLVTSALLTIPYVAEGLPLQRLWLLLPGSLTLMLPFAILPAIDAMRRDGQEPTDADRRGALILTVVAVVGVAIGQGWLTPAANQRWRNEMATEFNGRPTAPSRGIREVTTGELIAGDVAIIPALHGTPRVREINMRISLALLPAVLVWLRWQSLNGSRRRSWAVARSFLLALAATGAYIAVMPAARGLELAFFAPGYGPSLVLALLAVTVRSGIWWRQRAV